MADDFLAFGSERIRREWDDPHLDPVVKSIVRDAANFAFTAFQWPLLLTCIWRTQGEDKALEGTGIHCYWRAIDIRTRDHPKHEVDALVGYLNGKYVYDPSRPTKVVAYGKPHGDGPHIHLQSFPGRTQLRPTPRET